MSNYNYGQGYPGQGQQPYPNQQPPQNLYYPPPGQVMLSLLVLYLGILNWFHNSNKAIIMEELLPQPMDTLQEDLATLNINSEETSIQFFSELEINLLTA